MWVNQLEMDGETGVDDDGNGYIDGKAAAAPLFTTVVAAVMNGAAAQLYRSCKGNPVVFLSV